MKILYVARKSVFLKGMLECVEHESNEVFVLDLKNRQYIDVNNGHVIQTFDSDMIIKSKVVNYIFRYVAAIHFLLKFRRERWDICHILNLKRENFWMIPFWKRNVKKVIVTVFGKSTYTTSMKRWMFAHVYRYVDLITFTSDSVADEFLAYNPAVAKSKVAIHVLPLSHFGDLVKIVERGCLRDYCEKLGLRNGLVNISCSSTIAKYDQHEKVIYEIKKLRCKESIQLMFLLTYGGDEQRKRRIIDLIERELRGFHYKIFTDFMSNEDISMFRAVTDVFINVRVSDQFAGAMIESLYAGACLISGSWLNYGKLDQIGLTYSKIDSVDRLHEAIEECLKDIYEFKDSKSKVNSALIFENLIKPHLVSPWNQLYIQQCESNLHVAELK